MENNLGGEEWVFFHFEWKKGWGGGEIIFPTTFPFNLHFQVYTPNLALKLSVISSTLIMDDEHNRIWRDEVRVDKWY